MEIKHTFIKNINHFELLGGIQFYKCYLSISRHIKSIK